MESETENGTVAIFEKILADGFPDIFIGINPQI